MKFMVVGTALYLGFFGLIGLTVWVTGSAWPLLALVFTPGYKSGKSEDEN